MLFPNLASLGFWVLKYLIYMMKFSVIRYFHGLAVSSIAESILEERILNFEIIDIFKKNMNMWFFWIIANLVLYLSNSLCSSLRDFFCILTKTSTLEMLMLIHPMVIQFKSNSALLCFLFLHPWILYLSSISILYLSNDFTRSVRDLFRILAEWSTPMECYCSSIQ